MSKKIDGSIIEILESNKNPNQKIEELIELRYTSLDIIKIVNAIKSVFDSDFDVELADSDIKSEISNIAFFNEGILSKPDEKKVGIITKEREKMLTSLKDKLKKLKETKKRTEKNIQEDKEEDSSIIPETEESGIESIINMVQPEKEDKGSIPELKVETDDALLNRPIMDFTNLVENDNTGAEEKIMPTYETKNIYNSGNPSEFFEPFNPGVNTKYDTRFDRNYPIYDTGLIDDQIDTDEDDFSDDIDRRIEALSREAATLTERAQYLKEQNNRLIGIKMKKNQIIKDRDAMLARVDQEAKRRKQEIIAQSEEEIRNLFSELR